MVKKLLIEMVLKGILGSKIYCRAQIYLNTHFSYDESKTCEDKSSSLPLSRFFLKKALPILENFVFETINFSSDIFSC